MRRARPTVLVWAVLAAVLVLAGSAQAGVGVSGKPHGPEGGYVPALAIDPVDPATVYAGAYGSGVFKSVDGGSNWRVINVGLTETGVQALAIDPRNPAILYVGTQGPLFKSTNAGAADTIAQPADSFRSHTH